jgi:hypothetical protein
MKKWTLMVYISADDVLANFAVESLKELKRAASEDIQVFAEFDPNVPGKEARLYLFKGDVHSGGTKNDSEKTDASIESNELETTLGCDVDMNDPKHLTKFIKMATTQCRADHYGLVLWGHGPELLFDDGVPPNTPSNSRRYLTPDNLRKALQDPDLKANLGEAKLDIIAIDACSGALVEVASALQGCAKYLIASQDEVPDTSFPYEQLLDKVRLLCEKGDVKRISELIPQAYEEAFQDYIPTAANGLRGITLSIVDLDAIGAVATPLTDLADSLLHASTVATLRRKILDARKKCQAFEFGLFVDLVDFCDQLENTKHKNGQLTNACENMKEAINNPCVIANKATSGGKNIAGCHGLSVYFPYQTNDPIEQKIILAKNGTNHPTKDRIQRIKDLEEDYGELKTPGQAEWMEFIRKGWSAILAKDIPNQLDTHYSAQQCAQNLLPEADKTIKETLLLEASKKGEEKPSLGKSKKTKLALPPVKTATEKPRGHAPNGSENGSSVARHQ